MPKLPVNQSLCFHQQARNWQEEVQNISLFVKLLSHFDITELMSAIAYSGAIKRSEPLEGGFVEVDGGEDGLVIYGD
jgi:hypothetical protein